MTIPGLGRVACSVEVLVCDVWNWTSQLCVRLGLIDDVRPPVLRGQSVCRTSCLFRLTQFKTEVWYKLWF